MGRENVARRADEGRGRAWSHMRDDTCIVSRNVQSAYDAGCRWAGVALALTFGPLIAVGIWLGW